MTKTGPRKQKRKSHTTRDRLIGKRKLVGPRSPGSTTATVKSGKKNACEYDRVMADWRERRRQYPAAGGREMVLQLWGSRNQRDCEAAVTQAQLDSVWDLLSGDLRRCSQKVLDADKRWAAARRMAYPPGFGGGRKKSRRKRRGGSRRRRKKSRRRRRKSRS